MMLLNRLLNFVYEQVNSQFFNTPEFLYKNEGLV